MFHLEQLNLCYTMLDPIKSTPVCSPVYDVLCVIQPSAGNLLQLHHNIITITQEAVGKLNYCQIVTDCTVLIHILSD